MGQWQDFFKKWVNRDIGFRMTEEMSGTHRYSRDYAPGNVDAGVELPLEVKITWGSPKMEEFLNPSHGRFLCADLEGSISAGGLCTQAPIKGTLELRYFKDATLRYCFYFLAHERQFRYLGEKREIRPWNVHRTHTTCYGTITEVASNEILSESVIYFNLQDLPRFLGSFRFD